MIFVRCMREISKTIFDKYELNKKAKAMINAIQTKMKQKKLTDKGKECKGGIVTKLFYEKLSFYVSIAVIQVSYFDIWTKEAANTLTA